MSRKQKLSTTDKTPLDAEIEIIARQAKEDKIRLKKILIVQLYKAAKDNNLPFLLEQDTEVEDMETCQFVVENSTYTVYLDDRTYSVKKPGRGGNSGRHYPFRSVEHLFEIIKFYFWEYQGLEVLPSIDLMVMLAKRRKAA